MTMTNYMLMSNDMTTVLDGMQTANGARHAMQSHLRDLPIGEALYLGDIKGFACVINADDCYAVYGPAKVNADGVPAGGPDHTADHIEAAARAAVALLAG